MSVIFDLPIATSAPIYHLKSDPTLSSVDEFFKLSKYTTLNPDGTPNTSTLPSMMRRSRQIRLGANFSFVSPLPLEFPYDITEPGEPDTKIQGQESIVQATTIETRLAEYEPSQDHPITVVRSAGAVPSSMSPCGFTSELRETKFPKAHLLAFSKRCADAWLPNLDSGDASTVVISGPGSAEEVAKREQLVAVCAGKTVLAKPPTPDGVSAVERNGFAPYSLAYAGHQFGQFAGQLGDGRAISILSTPTTQEVRESTGMTSVELQLKGAGRTPFSRFADGLAVTRSSIREFLGAEAMAALGVPTSRALALVGIPEVQVRREKFEGASIVTRVAASWIRIGCFELPVYRQEWDSLSGLAHFVAREVFMVSDATCPPKDSTVSRSLSYEVLTRSAQANALMIAGWQAQGFMHGVINTDNVSIRGETIDYGPYAFMDVYDPCHVCNHSDEEGRYSFDKQPSMGIFAIGKLGEALASLIGCEAEIARNSPSQSGYFSAPQGWRAESVDEAKIKEWTSFGLDRLGEVKAEFMITFLAEYTRLMRLKLGLLTASSSDFDLVSSLLDLMNLYSLDFFGTLRLLSQFNSPLLTTYLDLIVPLDLVPAGLQESARVAFTKWFTDYEARLNTPEEVAAATLAVDRQIRMNQVNPRFVLRQWVLEEVIERVETKEGADVVSLDRVLQMAGEPFESYGEIILEGEAKCSLVKEEREEEQERARLCSMGSEKMLGFQCSCSS